jgi:hypothetical protein
MRNRITPAAARSLMERYELSGLSVQSFCTQKYLIPVTFYYWRKRLRSVESQEASVLVSVCFEKTYDTEESSGVGSGSLVLTYPNGVRLSVSARSEVSLIRELVMML